MAAKWRNFCIIVIVITIFADLMALAAFLYLDVSLGKREITEFRHCEVTRIVHLPQSTVISASFGKRNFLVETDKEYEIGDKVTIKEIYELGYFTNTPLSREWTIGG